MRCTRSDNGAELVNPGFVGLLGRLGVRREHTPVGSPEHNGVTERTIATTLDVVMVSCLETLRLFDDAKLPLTEPWADMEVAPSA